MTTAAVVFTLDELWLLQGVIRHEQHQQDTWHFPPASLALNDQIAEALVRCEECRLLEAAVRLTRGDCLVIDYCVPQGVKTPGGQPLGKNILMKSFRARIEIEQGQLPAAPEPEITSEQRARLAHLEEED